MNFHEFATAVHDQYVRLSKTGRLFTVGSPEDNDEVNARKGDELFAHYLASYPEGSNPIYKTRTEHDCSCCKNFVRNIGRVVALENGNITTVWGVKGLQSPFKEVAKAMDAYVKAQPIRTIFRTAEPSYGAESTRQLLEGGQVKRWNHFHAKVDAPFKTTKPDAERGAFAAKVQVFRRGLKEIDPNQIDAVLDLIDSKSIYRGEEKRPMVAAFRDLQKTYRAINPDDQELFTFSYCDTFGAYINNDVIGTLLNDLSAGMDVEQAVRLYESKVAPENYKRTTALITPRMVQDAMKTVEELGLEPALQRRLATLADVSVGDVLWVDRSARQKMKGGVADILMAAATSTAPKDDKATEISIDTFMKEVVPTAQSIDLHLRNRHLTNFVTVTAPVEAGAGKLFKWANGFGWSYDGNITDSIRQKVKTAGGNVDAKLRFSLAWHNYDDLDLHVKDPAGHHIYFGNKGRVLDVDMNAGRGTSRQPVENASFTRPDDGVYHVWVNQYLRRETTDVGFEMEIVSGAGIIELSYPKGVTRDVVVGTFTVKNGDIVKADIKADMQPAARPQEKWGLRTEATVKVQTLMYSPNYWGDNAVGNKHWFFILEGCRVEEPMRGIYNEFLSSELEKHRKVFEVLGDKSKCQPTKEQLSGLGFSSTRGDTVTVSVKSDRGTRLFNINF